MPAAAAIALKVDVDTLRGTCEGVPHLAALLRAHGADATFYFSVGPDNTGRAIKRVFRRGFFGKVVRTSVVSHYGLRTLMYGTLLPGPHIGRRAGDQMRAVRDLGFEVGLHCYDHVLWQDNVRFKSADWTRRQLQLGVDSFRAVFGAAPASHAAAGWQSNVHMLPLATEFGFTYTSDSRGFAPYWPTRGKVVGACLEIPTTLPTFDELIGSEDVTANNVADAVFAASRRSAPMGHVFTLHAELEGQKLKSEFERLLIRWREAGVALISMRDFAARIDRAAVRPAAMIFAEVPGRSGTLATEAQGHAG
jgi:peptidoglycan/xylan/chitin deacetylase (PgdA/CDA1 family)